MGVTEELLTRLVERVEGRYYGKYRGVVVDNADPEYRGRLKVRVPAIFGEEIVTGWAMPCAPYAGGPDRGLFLVPENEDTVWVEFEMGDLDYPVWVGSFWAKPGGASEVPVPADAQSPPTRKILRTLKGHSVEMEDKDGEEVFVITYNDGDKTNVITMNKDGLTIVDANENSVTMNADGIAVADLNDNKVTLNADGTAVVDKNGNKVTMDSSGTIIEDANTNKIEMTPGGISILPASVCNLGSGAVNLVNNLPACLFTGAPMAIDAKGHAKFLK